MSPARRSLLHFAPWTLVLCACLPGGADEEGRTVADSAGVALVTITTTDRPLSWTLAEVFRLGGADEGPGSFSAAYPSTVGTDAQGRVYVLDSEQFRVEVFDREGRHLRFLGRKGGGPGELDFPSFLTVEPDGVIGVHDIAKRAIVRWSADGELLPLRRLDGLIPPPYGPVAVRGDTLVYAHQTYGERTRGANLRITTPSDTVDLPGVESATGGMVLFSCMGMNTPPLFSREVAYASAPGRIATTLQSPYQVDLYEGLQWVRSVRRTIATETPTAHHVARLYPNGWQLGGGAGTCTVPASELYEKLGVSAQLPLIRRVALGPEGHLWVERYTFTDEPARVDVFDREGRYLGTLTGRGLPFGFVGRDVVLFGEEDADTGGMQVVGYRITT